MPQLIHTPVADSYFENILDIAESVCFVRDRFPKGFMILAQYKFIVLNFVMKCTQCQWSYV